MKYANSITFIFMIALSLVVLAQNGAEFRGVELRGTQGAVYQEEKALGLLEAYQPTFGVINCGTNVQVWRGMTGNQFNFDQYIITNQPSNILFGTNILGQSMPCIFFNTNAPQVRTRLKCDALATNFAGIQKPLTMIIAICSRSESANATAISFGYTSATNAGADRWGLRSQNGTSATTFFKACATNQTPPAASLTGANALATNVWGFIGVTFDGTTLRTWKNLAPTATVDLSLQTLTRLDTVTMGMLGHQSAYTQPWQGGIGETLLFTNGLSGLNFTNVLNRVNKRWNLYL